MSRRYRPKGGVTVRRVIEYYIVHVGEEKTWSVFKDGVCVASGFATFNEAREHFLAKRKEAA